MIKLETHCHIKGFSPCGDGDLSLTIKKYKESGYKAITVTNHFSKNYYDEFYQGKTDREKIDYFFNTYDTFSALCKKNAIKTFFGLEVRCLPTNTEYMLLGFDRAFLYDNSHLFDLSQEELFALADKNGIFMYQTHPFRTGVKVGNPKFMHGAEIFNGHYHHDNQNFLAEKFCKENNLIGVSGTDYHHDDQPITAGAFIPDDINDETALANYYFNNQFTNVTNFELYEKSFKEHKK